MATIFDRAAQLNGMSTTGLYISGMTPLDLGDPNSTNPTTIKDLGAPAGSPRQLQALPSWNITNMYNGAVLGNDQFGNPQVGFFNTYRGGAVGTVEPYSVVSADDKFTLLASINNGTYVSFFLISSVRLQPPTDPSISFPVTDMRTSGFSDANSLPPQIAPCFLAGTRLRTERGEVAVEDLVAGDLVRVANGAGAGSLPVTWIGSTLVQVARHPDPDLVRPVRIRAGAFGDGAPTRDLLVSPDHAIYTDGVLVPAHLLVNGGSIAADRAVTTAHYYHVELSAHAAVFADGLPAESYLDTGNRMQFGTEHSAVLHPDFAIVDGDAYDDRACARLAVDAATVQPIWQRLSDRSAELGLSTARAASVSDPSLQVTVDGAPAASTMDGDVLRVTVPAGAATLRILSRSARPSETRPWLDDRRALGVMVGGIAVVAGGGRREIAMDDAALTEGWWAIEQAAGRAARWTNGQAAVSLPAIADAAVVEVTLVGEMAYPAEALAA